VELFQLALALCDVSAQAFDVLLVGDELAVEQA